MQACEELGLAGRRVSQHGADRVEVVDCDQVEETAAGELRVATAKKSVYRTAREAHPSIGIEHEEGGLRLSEQRFKKIG